MLDVAPTELLLVAAVALIVIGPKDLPKAMRFVGYWVGRARGVARQFRSGFDEMVREAEFAEMEKKWAEENARIMRDYPSTAALPAPDGEARDVEARDAEASDVEAGDADESPAATTAAPEIKDEPEPPLAPPPADPGPEGDAPIPATDTPRP